MVDNFENISARQLCQVIDILHPCMDDYLYVYDFKNDFYYISPRAVERFSIPSNHFHNVVQNHEKFVYKEDLKKLQEELEELESGRKDLHNMEYRWLGKYGQPIWINCRGLVVRNEDGPCYMVGCINEIGAAQKADNVSGLLGGSSLKLYLQDNLPETPAGYFLRLGIDDFKEVNEKLGSEYGDMILRKVADCISECISPEQKLYRIVSDEFLVLDFQGGSREEGEFLYNQIRNKISLFVEKNLYEAVFTISAGILTCENVERFTYANLMRLTEFALNEAKRQGKNRSYTFDPQDYERFMRKTQLTQVIRQAVKNDFEGFEAYLQPLFHTACDAVYGAEALMRFHTEEYGMVSPGEFIPILEETGLIIPVGRWMLYQALEKGKKIQKYIPDFKISINVSYIQVLKSDIITEIISAVTEYKIASSTVIVELTESGLLDSDTRFSKLGTKLQEKGILLALDDFGTGYSNFHYLYDLHPDIIKFDRSFTAAALANEYEYNLLSLMAGMAHGMELKICVEGIETQEELDRIKKLSPDYCQGFFFGRPCPYEEFLEKFVV